VRARGSEVKKRAPSGVFSERLFFFLRSPSVILSPRENHFRFSYYGKIGVGGAPQTIDPARSASTRQRSVSTSSSCNSVSKPSSNPIPINTDLEKDEFFSAQYAQSVPVSANDVFLRKH
jgi:hypothetical protein